MTALKDMPEQFSIEFIEKIIFLQKIESGLDQSKRGDVLTTEQAKERLTKWVK